MQNASKTIKLINWGKDHFQDLVAVIFIIIFTLSGIATLKNYGINWDEGLGNIYFGERNLYYFRSLDPRFLDFSSQNKYLDDLPINASKSPMRDSPQAFPPFFDTVSAGSMHLFAYKLQWLDPIDGFHLATILFAAVLLTTVYFFFSKRLGKNIALIAIIMIGTFPRFFGDMHFNQKDVPELIAFSLAAISYYWWYEEKTWKRAVLAGILFGIAWAIKVNALFLPFIFIIGIWKWDFTGFTVKGFLPKYKKFGIHHLIMFIASLHIFFLSWPWLWSDPRRIVSYFQIFLSQGGRIGSQTFGATPILLTLTTMPEYFLVFLLIGIAFSVFWLIRKRDPLIRLLVVWMLIPIIRISLPGAVNFDGIRHFLEFLPAAAVLAAFGVVTAIKSIAWPKKWLKNGIILIVFLGSIFNIVEIEVTYHSYEFLYYNHFIGTREHASKLFGQDEISDYWAVTYRKGMTWINQNAIRDSYLYTPIAGWLVNITQRIWLRSDIQPIDRNQMEEIRKTDAHIYVMFVNRPAFYDDIATICFDKGEPIFEIDLKGSSLMQIYRFDELRK